jgi:uncharacterized protein (DUF924 family)
VSAPEDVLAFWFGELDASGRAPMARQKRWWMKDAAFDAEIASRFGSLHAEVARGEHDAWAATPRGRLALIVVLDQFSRNLCRGTPGSFACDARACELAREGIARGDDQKLAESERTILYMPLMHSEDLALQEQCVALFEALSAVLPEAERPAVAQSVKAARQHRDIIARFGRFPHRNTILGRQSSEAELTFLTQPGSSF